MKLKDAQGEMIDNGIQQKRMEACLKGVQFTLSSSG